MAKIEIKDEEQKDSGWVFKVRIVEENSSSKHEVNLTRNHYQLLSPAGVSPKKLVKESFRFLLEREPKESILNSFDLSVISNYFPEYDKKITQRLLK